VPCLWILLAPGNISFPPGACFGWLWAEFCSAGLLRFFFFSIHFLSPFPPFPSVPPAHYVSFKRSCIQPTGLQTPRGIVPSHRYVFFLLVMILCFMVCRRRPAVAVRQNFSLNSCFARPRIMMLGCVVGSPPPRIFHSPLSSNLWPVLFLHFCPFFIFFSFFSSWRLVEYAEQSSSFLTKALAIPARGLLPNPRKGDFKNRSHFREPILRVRVMHARTHVKNHLPGPWNKQ